MGSDEEYLDSLLQSIMENGKKNGQLTEENALTEHTDYPADEKTEQGMNDFAIEDFGEEELMPDEEENAGSLEGDLQTDGFGADDFAIEDFGVMEEPPEEEPLEDEFPEILTETDEESGKDSSGGMSPEDIEAMFAAASEAASETENVAEEQPEEDATLDDDLAEISGLLKQSEDGGMTDDDMLALLESMSMGNDSPETETMGEGNSAAETSEENAQDGGPGTENAEECEGKKEKKKLFSRRIGKKKKKDETSEPSETEGPELINPEENLDFDLPQAPGKKNIFTKIFSFLTEADEEEISEKIKAENGMEPSDENRNILEELDEEDRKKKKKKVKGKKGKKQDNPSEEGEEEEPTEEPKKKKKKEKKKKEPIESVLQIKPAKKVSPGNIGIIAGLSLTLTAVVIVFSSVVPGFFDKREARDAYYQADYSKSYELLYGKKLDNSDTIIFNKSKVVLQMNRKLDSYHNYVSLGKEVEALDALMSGVERYPSIYAEAEEYHVGQEVNAIYETILTVLADRYHISEGEAGEIIAYDDLAYTMKLESIINGTPFVMPRSSAEQPTENPEAKEPERPSGTQTDMLPEEQEILKEELPLGGGTVPETEEAPEPQQPETIQPEPVDSAETDSAGTDSGPETDNQADAQGGGQGQLIEGLRQPLEININQ